MPNGIKYNERTKLRLKRAFNFKTELGFKEIDPIDDSKRDAERL